MVCLSHFVFLGSYKFLFLESKLIPDNIFDTKLNCHLFPYAVALSVIKELGEFQ